MSRLHQRHHFASGLEGWLCCRIHHIEGCYPHSASREEAEGGQDLGRVHMAGVVGEVITEDSDEVRIHGLVAK